MESDMKKNKIIYAIIIAICVGTERIDAMQSEKIAIKKISPANINFDPYCESIELQQAYKSYKRPFPPKLSELVYNHAQNIMDTIDPTEPENENTVKDLISMFLSTSAHQPEAYTDITELSSALASAYYCNNDYDNAIKYFNVAIDANLKDVHPENANLKNRAINLLSLMAKNLLDEKPINCKRAIECLKKLPEFNPYTAITLGSLYFKDGQYEKAYQWLLQQLPRFSNDPALEKSYNNACFQIGLMFEQSKIEIAQAMRPEERYKNAFDYFQKANDIPSAARLIWMGKINGDRDKALITLKEYAEQGSVIAILIYSSALIAQGKQVESIKFIQNIKNEKQLLSPINILQLGIAYQYGIGVPKNVVMANNTFTFLINTYAQDKTNRTGMLTMGYMTLIGLGTPQNIDKGLELIKESEKAQIDDVYIETKLLFPIIGIIEEEEEAKKAKATKQTSTLYDASKKKGEANNKTAGESSTHASTQEEPEQNILDLTPEQWNNTFEVFDGSKVTSIDRANSTITILDPGTAPNRHKETLVVKLNPTPYRKFTQVRYLQKAPRIAERQGLGSIQLPRNTIIDHSFADMLDYVIQYAGQLVPFAKDGSSQINDQLVAQVTRKNLATKKEFHCTAEYTFYLKHGKPFLYHRVLNRN